MEGKVAGKVGGRRKEGGGRREEEGGGRREEGEGKVAGNV